MRLYKTALRVGLGIFAASVLAGCGVEGGAGPATATVTVTETASVPADPASSTSAAAAPGSDSSSSASSAATVSVTPSTLEELPTIGDTQTHGGATVTLIDAEASRTLERNTSGHREGSGYETFEVVEADQGGRFVIATTEVQNDGSSSMDLTCSLPIMAKVVDAQGREFDTVKSLYELRGNPECNDQLQPGFSSEMTYAFLVPEGADIRGIYFQDLNLNDGDGAVFAFVPSL